MHSPRGTQYLNVSPDFPDGHDAQTPLLQVANDTAVVADRGMRQTSLYCYHCVYSRDARAVGAWGKEVNEVECKVRLENYLRENGVPFEAQQHPRAVTAQEVAASEHVPGKMLAKTVMVQADGKLFMLALPAPYQVDLERAATALGVANARLSEEEEFEDTFPDCETGAMPPFGNLYGVPVCVEQSLAEDETIVFRAGTHTETMSVRYSDFERLVEPTVAEFARRN
jgi:Ala-tRNA(Pro) deacylase